MGGVAGKILSRPMGAYSVSKVYKILDVVSHNQTSWMCRVDTVQGVEPNDTNTVEWQKLFDITLSNADTLDGFHASYFASKANVSRVSTISFDPTKWSVTSPFTQTVTVNGLKETDTPVPSFVDDGEVEADTKLRKKAYDMVTEYDSSNEMMTVTCRYKRPTSWFTIALKGV